MLGVGVGVANPSPNPNQGWTTCKTSHSQNSVSVADVAEKIQQCAAAAVTGKAEL